MTTLELVYTPGVLALMKRRRCDTRNHNENNGCCNRQTHMYQVIAGTHVLQGDEQAWAGHYAPRKQDT